jgi:hypothetical protein
VNICPVLKPVLPENRWNNPGNFGAIKLLKKLTSRKKRKNCTHSIREIILQPFSGETEN